MTKKQTHKVSIYQFNHISKDLPDASVQVLSALYKHYHKKQWCYKQLYSEYKRLNLIFTLGGSGAILSGVVAGGITLNPIVLAIVTSVGVVAKVVSEVKNFSNKQEMCKYAYTTYDKILTDIRTNLRGEEYDHHDYILYLKTMDENIIDLSPAMKSRITRKYDAKFTD